jgi:hypothetical protein
MFHLALAALAEIEGPQQVPVAVFAFLSIGAIALFGIFLPVAASMEARRKEREAYYKSEMIRRLAEAQGEGAKAAMQLLYEEERQREAKRREGLKIGGLVNIAVGIGLSCMLWAMTGPHGPYLVGMIPGLIGVALLVYVFFMAEAV